MRPSGFTITDLGTQTASSPPKSINTAISVETTTVPNRSTVVIAHPLRTACETIGTWFEPPRPLHTWPAPRRPQRLQGGHCVSRRVPYQLFLTGWHAR